MRIVWDDPKRLANLDKHGLDFSRTDAEFNWDAALVIPPSPAEQDANE
jgi:uncharacterized protein